MSAWRELVGIGIVKIVWIVSPLRNDAVFFHEFSEVFSVDVRFSGSLRDVVVVSFEKSFDVFAFEISEPFFFSLFKGFV